MLLLSPRRMRLQMKTTCLFLAAASASAFSASDPDLCSHVTCETVLPHTCAYNSGNYAGAAFHQNIGNKYGENDGCDNRVHNGLRADGLTGHLNSCNGAYQWTGLASTTCTGEEHKSMRITHTTAKVGESRCTNGHRCGIGIATGGASCECVPVCSLGDSYFNGACRSNLSIGVKGKI